MLEHICLVLKTAAVIALCGVVAVSSWQVSRAVTDTLGRAQGLSDVLTSVRGTSDAATGLLRAATPAAEGLGDTERHINAAVDLTSHRMNDLCPGAMDAARPCGSLADFNRTLATYRSTAGQIEIAANQFDQHEGQLFVQEQAAYTSMQSAADGAARLANNPDIPVIASNLHRISSDAVQVTDTVAVKVKRFSWWKPWTW